MKEKGVEWRALRGEWRQSICISSSPVDMCIYICVYIYILWVLWYWCFGIKLFIYPSKEIYGWCIYLFSLLLLLCSFHLPLYILIRNGAALYSLGGCLQLSFALSLSLSLEYYFLFSPFCLLTSIFYSNLILIFNYKIDYKMELSLVSRRRREEGKLVWMCVNVRFISLSDLFYHLITLATRINGLFLRQITIIHWMEFIIFIDIKMIIIHLTKIRMRKRLSKNLKKDFHFYLF